MRNNASKITALIIFISLFSCFISNSYSQVRLTSCGLDLVIPSFKGDSVFSDASQIFVRKQFLRPIRLSKSAIEIRLYSYPYFMPGRTVVIQCDGEKFKIDHYGLGYQSITQPGKKNSKIKNLGALPENPEMDVLVFYEKELKLKGGSWNEFFQKLIDNHFFNLIPEIEIQRKVKATHPEIIGRGESALYVQIKVGNHFRNMILSTGYEDNALDVPEYQNLQNIYSALRQIQ